MGVGTCRHIRLSTELNYAQEESAPLKSRIAASMRHELYSDFFKTALL